MPAATFSLLIIDFHYQPRVSRCLLKESHSSTASRSSATSQRINRFRFTRSSFIYPQLLIDAIRYIDASRIDFGLFRDIAAMRLITRCPAISSALKCLLPPPLSFTASLNTRDGRKI